MSEITPISRVISLKLPIYHKAIKKGAPFHPIEITGFFLGPTGPKSTQRGY